MLRRPPRSTLSSSSAASDVYKRQQYYQAKLPQKLPLQESTKKDLKNLKNYEDAPTYLENSVGNIVMKVLAQLGYQKLKYPNLTPQETSMKFISICLKANNIYKDQRYRNKYQEKLAKFLKHCEYPQDIMDQFQRKKESQDNEWTDWDEQNLQTMTEQYDQFLKDMHTKDKDCLLYTSPSPRDRQKSRMPSSA
eukprot:TRINITY_DN3029_c0_g1_i9.p1 TRINITY_DN3029_c0_g1~~TRINITY_DN3029_c0_g1_i9.p1  ORF type:complete len:193 (-),score=46.23 TRINITY_DN3029_c0_g1_i9:46-624(-)